MDRHTATSAVMPFAARPVRVAGPAAERAPPEDRTAALHPSLDPRVALLRALRERLDPVGAAEGCRRAACGGFGIDLNGQSVLVRPSRAGPGPGCEVFAADAAARTTAGAPTRFRTAANPSAPPPCVLVLRPCPAPASDRGVVARGGLAPWQLQRAIERIEERLREGVSLAELVVAAGLSPRHFCTAFRRSTGEPPRRHLLRRRVERAQKLLADARLSITEVALTVGFASSAHFATSFRKQVGTTPSAWRRGAEESRSFPRRSAPEPGLLTGCGDRDGTRVSRPSSREGALGAGAVGPGAGPQPAAPE